MGDCEDDQKFTDSFALGSILLLVAVVDELIIVLRGGKPTYVAAVEERHARGDFSSDV